MIKFNKLTKEAILGLVSQDEVMEKYLGIPISESLVTNPLRNDKKPGCSFWRSSSDRLYLRDWAKDSIMDCFDVVMIKYKLNFYQALKRINKDFNLELDGVGTSREPKAVKLKAKERRTVQAIPMAWTKASLSYWDKYGIKEDLLNKYFVYDTKFVYVNNELTQRATEGNPIFTYLYPPTTNIKIYRPVDKTNKWKTTTTKENVDGLFQLPEKGKLLIVTSSRKDVMTLKTLGFNAIAPASSEHTLIDKKVIAKLKKRFDEIIVFMDSDDAGFQSAHKYWVTYGLNSINIPLKFHVKDISDFRSTFKERKTWLLMKKLIKDRFNQRSLPF